MKKEIIKAIVDHLKQNVGEFEQRVYIDSDELDLLSLTRPFATVRILTSENSAFTFTAAAEQVAENFVFWIYVFCRSQDISAYEFISLPEKVANNLLGCDIAVKDDEGETRTYAHIRRVVSNLVGDSEPEAELWNYCTVVKLETTLYRAKDSSW